MSDVIYEAVLPCGKKYYAYEIKIGNLSGKEDICRDALRYFDYETPWKNPQKVTVVLYSIKPNDGKLDHVRVGTYQIQPQITSMDYVEYVEELRQIVEVLPSNLQQFVTSELLDEDCSYEERISKAHIKVGRLLECGVGK
jgi:hypothetical protein